MPQSAIFVVVVSTSTLLVARLLHRELRHMQAPATDYVSAATEAVLAIHRAEVPGDVLVFLTGKSEVHECVDALRQGSNTMAMRHVQDRLKPMPLHAGALLDQLSCLRWPRRLACYVAFQAGHARVRSHACRHARERPGGAAQAQPARRAARRRGDRGRGERSDDRGCGLRR